jgi:tRNA-2-methylthio-N6-dimethylallyladenosine synthase
MSNLGGMPTSADADRPSVYVETYGCQMNVSDSELITGVLSARGYRSVAAPQTADIILLNTCAVREHAEQRVAQRVRHLIGQRKGGRRVRIGLAGCMAQHHREALLARIPGLDFVVGPDGYRHLPDLLESEEAFAEVRLDKTETYDDIVPVRGESVRAWLTIMRGCNRFCTFCVVPYVRGRERSIVPEVLEEELHRIAAEGYREVVLLGQTVNAYRSGGTDFGDLLRMAASIDRIERVRFTSPHPADFDDSSLAAMRDCNKVSPYVHLPLQSASDRILRAMDRGHTVDEYRRLVDRLRDTVPGVALSTDIIVGYPGETSEDFEATSSMMEEIGFDHAYLFKYSPREATRAFKIEETVTEDEKSERLARLISEQEARSLHINQGLVGHDVEVLVEGPAKRQKHWLAGKTAHFKTVVFEPKTTPVDAARALGELAKVRIEAATSHTLRGVEID